MNDQEKLDLLLERLEELLKRQQSFSKEVDQIRVEIYRLKKGVVPKREEPIENSRSLPPLESAPKTIRKRLEVTEEVETETPRQTEPSTPFFNMPPDMKENFEKFIGENLINKIGIIITILGVAIGAKYTIDNDLISPLTRIILGYLMGLGLLAFGMKLKTNYHNFSAVLVSGAMAIMYFITFAAYDFYGIFPQVVAFGLMVIFTIFTVLAALNYDKQLIAHVGLVGAYAVPFLLSNNSGSYATLFTYTAIINIGILVIAFKKYWKPLYYVSFALTWLMFVGWFFQYSYGDKYVALTFIFLSIFFATFYITFLAYKLLRQEQFEKSDVVLILLNSFIFYGLGYAKLEEHVTGNQLLGVFTLGNGIIHFAVSVVIFRLKLVDRKLLYLISGLVLVFITMAIPVQLDGNWVTIMWAVEAAVLFWVGRSKQVAVFEKLSYIVMALAFGSLIQDWDANYNNAYQSDGIVMNKVRTLLNVHFLSSVIFVLAFAFMNWVAFGKKYERTKEMQSGNWNLFQYALPAILTFVVYNMFRVEIENYWQQLYVDDLIRFNTEGERFNDLVRNYDSRNFKMVWVVNYTLFFVSLLSFVNLRFFKNRILGFISLGLNVFALLAFLSVGLYELSELRESYLAQTNAEYFGNRNFNLIIRYISFGFVSILLFACFRYIRAEFMQFKQFQPNKIFDMVLYISILWIASSELIHWLDLSGNGNTYKLGLSIFWGVYALYLIGVGIWKKKQHLRLGAIVLFGGTLLKLFFYDLSDLNTISKTIVLVSLGVLLLIISFLYNKYNYLIADENENTDA